MATILKALLRLFKTRISTIQSFHSRKLATEFARAYIAKTGRNVVVLPTGNKFAVARVFVGA